MITSLLEERALAFKVDQLHLLADRVAVTVNRMISPVHDPFEFLECLCVLIYGTDEPSAFIREIEELRIYLRSDERLELSCILTNFRLAKN